MTTRHLIDWLTLALGAVALAGALRVLQQLYGGAL
jgi:hypothetical protein